MDITLRELVDKQSTFFILLGAKGVDPYASFRLRKFLKIVREELTSVEEARIKLIDDLGEKQPDGSKKITDPKKLKVFESKLATMLNEVIVLPNVTVKVGEIANATSDVSCPVCQAKVTRGITPNDFVNLDFILEQDEPVIEEPPPAVEKSAKKPR